MVFEANPVIESARFVYEVRVFSQTKCFWSSSDRRAKFLFVTVFHSCAPR